MTGYATQDEHTAIRRREPMRVPIAVADPVPTYRRGLTSAFADAGFAVEAVEDTARWAAEPGPRALVLTLDLPEDAGEIDRLMRSNPELVVLALIKRATTERYHDALREGASGVMAWDEVPEKLIEVLFGVLDGYCLLPSNVVRAMVRTNGSTGPSPGVSDQELEWLQRLADGATVTELAKEACYSEREMFRILNRLYRRMGVGTRMEAIVKAARFGLLNDQDRTA